MAWKVKVAIGVIILAMLASTVNAALSAPVLSPAPTPTLRATPGQLATPTPAPFPTPTRVPLRVHVTPVQIDLLGPVSRQLTTLTLRNLGRANFRDYLAVLFGIIAIGRAFLTKPLIKTGRETK